jgi:hypothetical protein
MNQLLAHTAMYDLACEVSDVSNAFPSQNWITDPLCKNPRKICTKLNVFQSGTGKEEYLALYTITNGLRDASSFWK